MGQSKNFHVIMFAQSQQMPCQDCHTDHHGAEASLTDQKMVNFPHDQLGFSLKKHLKTASGAAFACADCHPHTFTRPEKSLCVDCHSQYQGAFMQAHQQAFPGDCLSCHDGIDRFSDFDHAKTPFVLTGMHQQVPCQDCHHGVQTIAELQGLPQDCKSCHAAKDPHAGQFEADCSACHTTASWTPTSFDHNSIDFKLDGKHQAVECNTCHKDLGLSGNRLYKGLPTDCFSCHAKDEPHEGRFGSACETCHTTQGWFPAKFDHNLASFHLDGKHSAVACEACHNQTGPTGRPLYKGTPTDCAACHNKDDAHAGSLGTACADCHTTSGWTPSTYDHNRSPFRLTGAHIQVNCRACHDQTDSAGHRVFKGTPTNCVACHANDDAHKGQFGSDCQTCHSTNAWKPATFDHSRTSFQLTGAHANAACLSCHSKGFKGTSSACVSCHASDDAHNGQFGSDCQTCHSTNAWKPATFDHSRTGFQLTGAHANTACQSCHSSGYKGTPSACVSCHQEPAVHAGQFGTACQNCHTTSAWLPAGYNGPHNFPMNHGGANSCQDCHTSSLSSWTCYTCHDRNEIQQKHTEEGIGDFSNCISCHPNGSAEEGGGDGGGDD